MHVAGPQTKHLRPPHQTFLGRYEEDPSHLSDKIILNDIEQKMKCKSDCVLSFLSVKWGWAAAEWTNAKKTRPEKTQLPQV